MDKIVMQNMAFFGSHGVLPEETALGQKFFIDMTLSIDLKKAGETDDLNYSVSYADVYADVKKIVEGDPFKLIEAVAENIASTVLQKYAAIQAVEVAVKKPEAPVRGIFDYFAVSITRTRS